MLYTTSLADVLSNARVKKYPTSDVLQIANVPIFRRPGFEERERPYAVPAKGGARDPERALAVSRARAKAAVRDIAMCNQFTHFFTWTLDPAKIDRYDRDAIKKRVYHFLKNTSHRKGFSYVCVPELHEDGAIHFHGLCGLGSVKLVRAINPHSGKELSDPAGRPVYNMSDWTLGFSTCVPIDENYERTCNYLTKYLSKGTEKIFGKWYLSSRALIKRPEIELIDGGMDYRAFLEENPELPIIPLYRDVCMTTMPMKGA